MPAYTTTYQFEKPDYKLLRFDIPVNANFDLLDAALKNFPSGIALGTSGNNSQVVLTSGVLWRDTINHILKVYSSTTSSWESLHSDAYVLPMKTQADPSSNPASGVLNYYASSVSSIACPTWLLSNGIKIILQQFAAISSIVTSSLINPSLTTVTATNTTDQSSNINTNESNLQTSIDNLNTVVNNIATALNSLIANLITMGIIA